jgi:hypothetical protein
MTAVSLALPLGAVARTFYRNLSARHLVESWETTDPAGAWDTCLAQLAVFLVVLVIPFAIAIISWEEPGPR